MENNQPEPKKSKKDIEDLMSKLGKRLEDGEKFTLSGLASEDGLQYERMLRAQQLIGLSIRLSLPFSDDTWKEFGKLMLDDEKLSAILGDMKHYVDDGPCPHNHDEEGQ